MRDDTTEISLRDDTVCITKGRIIKGFGDIMFADGEWYLGVFFSY